MDQQSHYPQEDNNTIRDKNQPIHDQTRLIGPPDTSAVTNVPSSTSRSVLSWLTRQQNNNIATTNNSVVSHDDAAQANGLIAKPPALVESPNDVDVSLATGSGDSPVPQSSWYAYYTSFVFPSSGSSPAMEHMPLLQGNLSITKDEDEGANNSTWGWFHWLTGTNQQAQEDEVSDESSEAYKAAKSVIESSKEECHYLYKSTDDFQTFEMSVCGTPTENLPVLIHTKKHKPKSANEVFEKTLRQKNNEEGETLPKPTISPKFIDNYREITWKTKTRLLTTDVICGYNTEQHLYRKKQELVLNTSKQLKKIVIITVHNFLPVKLVRALIGEYTGNAVEYAKLATKAVRTWLKQNSPEYCQDEIVIESISIDGQGKVSTCVEDALGLLRNYTRELYECDFIYVVGYGTSSPIAINILAELLSQNHRLCRKRIGVLSMSGNLSGPIPSKFSKIVYRAYTQLENDIFKEAFEYGKKESVLSRKLTESMRFLLEQNVKFCFSSPIGGSSFIPLYSSLGLQFDHPNIHRNLYQVNATTPFITTVVDIACQMKNLGVFRDHNIIRILSEKVDIDKTGNYIFNDEQVYLEGLRFTLESTRLHKLKQVHIGKEPRKSSSNTSDLNLLAYNFRGFIQEFSNVKHIGSMQQLRNLIKDYKNWKPTNLNSKDVKYCLAALEDFEIEDLFI